MRGRAEHQKEGNFFKGLVSPLRKKLFWLVFIIYITVTGRFAALLLPIYAPRDPMSWFAFLLSSLGSLLGALIIYYLLKIIWESIRKKNGS